MTKHSFVFLLLAGLAACKQDNTSVGKDPAQPSSQVLDHCPEDLPGSTMVLITHPKKNYCIDTTEASQADYQAFLSSAPKITAQSREECQKNTTFEPLQQAPDIAIGGCGKGTYDPEKTPDSPVTCVDWCDAIAYCQWAGKRLCGAVGGGSIDAETEKDSVMSSQLGYACSQGGKTTYPYGNTFEPGRCFDGSKPQPTPSVNSTCKGEEEPYSKITAISTGVSEWEDACNSLGSCWFRGGIDDFFPEEKSKCEHSGWTLGKMQHFVNVGFRCCYDLRQPHLLRTGRVPDRRRVCGGIVQEGHPGWPPVEPRQPLRGYPCS